MKSELAAWHNSYAWWVAWPLILFAVLGACSHSCSAPAAGGGVVKAKVNSFGQEALVAFVSASPGEHGRAEVAYGSLVQPACDTSAAPARPDSCGFPYPDQTVLGVADREPVLLGTRADKSQEWEVSAAVLATDGQQIWQQRVIVTAKGVYRLDGLPGVIPPEPTEPPTSGARQLSKLDEKSAVYTTVKDFLNAWLTGSGDLSRVADTTTVAAFKTPPHDSVEILSVDASRVPEKIEGSITAATTIIATKSAATEMSYTLTMAAASGRWIVTNVSAGSGSS